MQTMADYCTILLNQAHKSDVLAACIQADAALKAGDAQAAATRCAGWLSFGVGICAVVGALYVGYLAYQSATVQNQEIRNQRLAREAAYTAQICAMIIDATDEIVRVVLRIELISSSGRPDGLEGMSFINLPLLRDELRPINWERHALLGPEHLDQIIRTHACVRALMDQIDMLNSRPLPNLSIRRELSEAFNAKTQCEKLMSALAPKAPLAMRAFLVPIKLQSVQEPRYELQGSARDVSPSQ